MGMPPATYFDSTAYGAAGGLPGTEGCVSPQAGQRLWLFTAPQTGRYTFLVDPSEPDDLAFLVRRSSCTNDGDDVCIDAGLRGDTELTALGLAQGETLFLLVGGYGAQDQGGYSLGIGADSCGNGAVQGDEQCDDGNWDAGDGCTPDCRNENCSVPAVAQVGWLAGDTFGRIDETDSRCAAGEEEAWSFTPNVSAMLDLRLISFRDQAVSVRTTCSDTATELGCADVQLGGLDEVLSVPVEEGVPVTILVEADRPGYGGEYELYLELRQRECGDGLREGPTEQCDDGNTANGDGCSATCEHE